MGKMGRLKMEKTQEMGEGKIKSLGVSSYCIMSTITDNLPLYEFGSHVTQICHD